VQEESSPWLTYHVKPLTLEGSDDSTNFVLTHFDCNRQKQDSSLYVVRCMKRHDKIRDEVYKKLAGLQISRICFQVLEVQSMICRFKFRATEFATPWKRLKGSPLKQLRNRFALTQFSWLRNQKFTCIRPKLVNTPVTPKRDATCKVPLFLFFPAQPDPTFQESSEYIKLTAQQLLICVS